MKKHKKKNTRQFVSIGTIAHQLRLLVLPHRANHYRPHLVRRFGLVVVIATAFALPVAFGGGSVPSGSVLGDASEVTPQSVFEATNKERARRGLNPLESNAKLSQAAAQKGNDMLQHDYWAHTSPSGVKPWHWFDQVGYQYSAAGENLAKNFGSSSALMSAWLASPEHRANLLGDRYQDIGIAVVSGSLNSQPTELIVALYGAPQTAIGTLGAQTTVPTLAAQASLSPLEHLMMSWQTLTPAAGLSLIVLIVAGAVALLAHFYRKQLPKTLRQGWYRHHGLYKALGMASLAVVFVALYGGGQI